ncbi:MAG: hypothetical protein WDO18_01040 [Acidobacteriota bacterium]
MDLTVGPDGYLYYLSRGGSSVVRVNYTPSTRCDLTGDSTTNVGDVVRLVNVILGLATGTGTEDLNGDSVVNVVDVQWMVLVALGAACPV